VDEDVEADLARFDALYEGFPDPAEWAELDIDMSAWDTAAAALANLRADDPALANELRDRAFREAGIDTGAIEGLYTTDRGFTMTVADAASLEEAARYVRSHKGDDVEALFRSQVEGYEMALDLVVQGRPVTESWIRQLHEVIVGPQKTYDVVTPQGPALHELPKGRYKQYPNHVIQPDGTTFAYAPVAAVGPEMSRLVDLVNGDAVAGMHPVMASAWLHYALVRIHPFADGNGRVTRVVASLPLLRTASVPFKVPADRRDAYIGALELADAGEAEAFARFVRDEISSTLRLFVRTAQETQRSGSDVRHAFRRVLLGDNLDRPDLDAAARVLLDEVGAAVHRRMDAVGLDDVEIDVVDVGGNVPEGQRAVPPDGWRRFIENELVTRSVVLRALKPVYAATATEVMVVVARTAKSTDLMVHLPAFPLLDERVVMAELVPEVSGQARRRLEAWADAVILELQGDLIPKLEAARRERGYG
jgi:Fic family protein